MAAAATAELLELKPVRRVLFVLGRHVIPLLTVRTLKNYVISRAFRHVLPLAPVLCPSPLVLRNYKRTEDK